MAQITKDTMIGELLRDQEHIDSIAEVLFGIGMHGTGLPVFPDGDNRAGCYGAWH